MKLKFWVLSILLLFARGCDFYSTSLWFFQPGGMDGETNPLTRYLGVGWNGLVVVNVLIIGLILCAFYFYSFRYKPTTIRIKTNNFYDFVSELYFNERGKFYKLFYTMPKNKKILIAHVGYVLVRVVIVGSFLATIHNLCQYYEVAFYDTFRNMVRRPLYVIYGLIIISFIYFQYKVLNGEFTASIRQLPQDTV